MAEKKASLIVELIDKASSGLSSLKQNWLAVTAAVSGAVLFLREAYIEWGKQRESIVKVENALRNNGMEVANTSQKFQDMASALQKNTIFADENILAMQATLLTFRLTENQVSKLTPIILDYASATGQDLTQAAWQLGKAIESGNIGQLTRLGIIIDENKFKTDALGAITDALSSKYLGMAEIIAGEPLGQLAKLKNAFGELIEKIGLELYPAISQLIQWLIQLTNWFTPLKTAIDETITLFFQFGMAIGGILQAMSLALTGHFSQAGKLIKATFENIKYVGEKTTKDMHKNISKMNADFVKQETEADKKAKEEKEKYDAEWSKRITKNINDMQKEREENLKSSLTRISSLATAHNAGLAAIGKATGIAVATMDTYQAANKALASAPPPWNFALAAGVVAAGLANVAKIAGVELAEGGVILPRNGGTFANIAEAGKSEAVIPLDDDRTKEKLRGVFGGETVVNINAGVLVADNESLRRLAIEIDKKLFELQRNGQTLAV